MSRFEYLQYGHLTEHVRGEDLPQSKLDDGKVRSIRSRYGPRTARELAAEYGVHIRTIEDVVSWKNWRHVR